MRVTQSNFLHLITCDSPPCRLPWSSSTAGPLTGQPILAPLSGEFASGPEKMQDRLTHISANGRET